MTSGMVLRQARERKGLDLNTVARRLRIRPDILRAIENGDFSGMPPRGYTRNMVNAYARLVGLNPTEVVNMYLDEVRANQVARAHASSSARGFTSERADRSEHHRTSFADLDGGADDRAHNHRDANEHEHKRSLFTRDLYDDRTPFSRDDYGLMRDSTKRNDNGSRDFQSHHSGYDSKEGSGFSLPSFPFSIGGPSSRGRRTSTSNVGYSRDDYRGNASRFSSFAGNRSLIIAVALVALVILIIVLAVTISNRNAAARSEVSTLPVSGIADTTSGESSSAATTVAAPTSVAVTYTASGSANVYLQTYTNGVQANETLSAGSSQTVNVTGTWSIATWTPSNLTVTVDGKQVELTSKSTFNNMYAYTVDFKTYLEQWGKSHNQEVDTSNITSTVDSSGNDTLSVTSGPQPTTSSSSSSAASGTSSSSASRSSSSTTSTGTTTGSTTNNTNSTGTTSKGTTTGGTTSTNTTSTATTTR